MFHIRKIALGLTASAVLLVAAACGGGDDNGATGRATAVAGVPDGAAFVDQNNLRFRPATLTVAVGETVYFKNSETAIHTVTVNGENESGTMRKDDIFQWAPPSAGEYKITCEFHPQMKATITAQ